MAAEYHWSARRVEGELTDELLVLYLDAAVDRKRDSAQARFDSTLEAVRAGTIFAHDNRQYSRWRSGHATSAKSRAFTGEQLELAVMSLAVSNPEYVVQGA